MPKTEIQRRAEEMRRRAQENELRKNKKPIFNNDQFTQLKIVSKNKNENNIPVGKYDNNSNNEKMPIANEYDNSIINAEEFNTKSKPGILSYLFTQKAEPIEEEVIPLTQYKISNNNNKGGKSKKNKKNRKNKKIKKTRKLNKRRK